MAKPLPPFSCTFSPNIPELLYDLKCSVSVSTYQAGKLVLISPKNREELIQLPRNFPRPMGIAVKGNKMAIASHDEVTVLTNDPKLGKNYPKQPNVYDSFYTPRASFYTGQLDMHDIQYGSEGLWGVNTRFSCLSLVNDDYSFSPKWKPNFISDLMPEDRCHLNGLALKNGSPKYVTALGQSNEKSGWRTNKLQGGILMDVEDDTIITDGLPMPHSPRVYNNELYVLLSATGQLSKINLQTNTVEHLKDFSGFARGMDLYEDYLFIGLSKLREKSSSFRDLPIAKKSVFAGIVVVYLPQMSVVGYIKYETSVEEIYDVRIVPNTIRPGLLGIMRPDHKLGISSPDRSFWIKPPENKKSVEESDQNVTS
ncbi:MAG: TIGR03032 family protein [Bacteroidota bacterium]